MSAFKHLSHEFLVVAGPPESFHYGGAAEYIVDPRFREQFDIPQVSLPMCSSHIRWQDAHLVFDQLLLVIGSWSFTGSMQSMREAHPKLPTAATIVWQSFQESGS